MRRHGNPAKSIHKFISCGHADSTDFKKKGIIKQKMQTISTTNANYLYVELRPYLEIKFPDYIKSPLRTIWAAYANGMRIWDNKNIKQWIKNRGEIQISYKSDSVTTRTPLGEKKKKFETNFHGDMIPSSFSYKLSPDEIVMSSGGGVSKTFPFSDIKVGCLDEDAAAWIKEENPIQSKYSDHAYKVVMLGTIPIQFNIIRGPKLISFKQGDIMTVNKLWACWKKWSTQDILKIIPQKMIIRERIGDKTFKHINSESVPEFLGLEAYIKMRDEYITQCEAVFELMLTMTRRGKKNMLLLLLPAAFLPWNHQTDETIKNQKGNGMVIHDIHINMVRKFSQILSLPIYSDMFVCVHNVNKLLKENATEKFSDRFLFSPLDILGSYFLMKEKHPMYSPVLMSTGEHNSNDRVGNGALGSGGLSALDERLAYLSPVVYRCMFNPNINPYIRRHIEIIKLRRVEIRPIKYDKLDKATDFLTMLKDEKEINTLFIFGDSVASMSRKQAGPGTSVIRPYKFMDPQRAHGIPVRFGNCHQKCATYPKCEHNGKNFIELRPKVEKHYIMDNVDKIKALLSTGKYTSLVYPAASDGTSFSSDGVGRGVLEFITNQIKALK